MWERKLEELKQYDGRVWDAARLYYQNYATSASISLRKASIELGCDYADFLRFISSGYGWSHPNTRMDAIAFRFKLEEAHEQVKIYAGRKKKS